MKGKVYKTANLEFWEEDGILTMRFFEDPALTKEKAQEDVEQIFNNIKNIPIPLIAEIS